MLTRKGEVLANPGRDENFSKLMEISEVMSKAFYIGCGDSVAANYVTAIHKCRKASNHILMDMPMNCCYVDLCRIKDK